MIKENLLNKRKENIVMMCGKKKMIKFECVKKLEKMGYD
jgi:hypothetical protein